MSFHPVVGFVAVAAAVIFGIGGLGSFHTVDEGERAVIKRYGEVVGVAGPGLHFKVPFIDSAESVSVQPFVHAYGTEPLLQAYSKDMQVGDLVVSVNFIPNPEEDAIKTVIVKYGSIDGYINREVHPKALQTIKSTFARYTAQSSNENQGELATAIFESLSKAIPTDIVTVASAQIEDISFSNAFESAMEQRKMNEIAVEMQIQANLKAAEMNKQTVDKSEADALSRQASADAAAYEQRAMADSKAHQIRVQGEAEAEAIKLRSQALANNPALIELTKAEKWDGQLPGSMIPGSSVPFLGIQ